MAEENKCEQVVSNVLGTALRSFVLTFFLCVSLIGKFLRFIFSDNRGDIQSTDNKANTVQLQQTNKVDEIASDENKAAIAEHVKNSTGSLGVLYEKVEYWSKLWSAIVSVTLSIFMASITMSKEQKNDIVGRYIFFFTVFEVLVYLLIMAGMLAQDRGDAATGAVCMVLRSVFQLYVAINVAGLALEVYAETTGEKYMRNWMRALSFLFWILPVCYVFIVLFISLYPSQNDLPSDNVDWALDRATTGALIGIKHSIVLLFACILLALCAAFSIRQPSTDVYKQIGLSGENSDGTRSSDSGWIAYQAIWIIAKCVSVAISMLKPAINIVYQQKVQALYLTLERLRELYAVRMFLALLHAILEKLKNHPAARGDKDIEKIQSKLDEQQARFQRESAALLVELAEVSKYVY